MRLGSVTGLLFLFLVLRWSRPRASDNKTTGKRQTKGQQLSLLPHMIWAALMPMLCLLLWRFSIAKSERFWFIFQNTSRIENYLSLYLCGCRQEAPEFVCDCFVVCKTVRRWTFKEHTLFNKLLIVKIIQILHLFDLYRVNKWLANIFMNYLIYIVIIKKKFSLIKYLTWAEKGAFCKY